MDREPPSDEVASGEAVVCNSKGMHARPCHAVVTLALGFECDIDIESPVAKANAKSILELMTLVAACGDTLAIRTKGSDAKEALAALQRLVKSGFNE